MRHEQGLFGLSEDKQSSGVGGARLEVVPAVDIHMPQIDNEHCAPILLEQTQPVGTLMEFR